MAVLTRKARWTRRVCAALTALAGAGCVLFDRMAPGPERYAFSHRVHVEQERLACVSCHESADVAEDPGMPSPDTCNACHESIDEGKPPERRVESLFVDGRYLSAGASQLGPEPIFSHQRHVTASVECGACHAGIEHSREISSAIEVPMVRCMDCHAERKVSNECATCHSTVRSNWQPETHHHQWKRLHGQVVRAGSIASADNCALCHQESRCITCHKEEQPQNHDNFFRLRGHGIAASMDRQNCAACHEPDSCDRCHREVLPQSHRGLWGAPKDTHCLGCHFPLASEGCLACHKDTPSHLLATPLPVNPPLPIPPHNPAMNCRQCHGISAPLPHVDKGDECTLCHR